VIIFAGFETTAALARALHMLAMHPHVQEQLRVEICDAIAAYQATDINCSHAKDEGGSVKLPYDALMSLPLPDAVVRGTFRPSLPILS
jgi:cytochrome P450